MALSPESVDRAYHLIQQIQALQMVRYDIEHNEFDVHTYGIKLRDLIKSPEAFEPVRLASDAVVYGIIQEALRELGTLGVDTTSIEIKPPLKT